MLLKVKVYYLSWDFILVVKLSKYCAIIMGMFEQLHLNPGNSQQGSQQGAEFLVRMLFYYPPSTGFPSHLEKRGIEITE